MNSLSFFHKNEKKKKKEIESSLESELGPLLVRMSFRNVKLKRVERCENLEQNNHFKVYLEKVLLIVVVKALGPFWCV